MKTTIDIPDALFRKAKIRAAQNSVSLKSFVVSALEKELSPFISNDLKNTPAYVLNEHGFPVLAGRDGVVVTDDLIKQIREEEGI